MTRGSDFEEPNREDWDPRLWADRKENEDLDVEDANLTGPKVAISDWTGEAFLEADQPSLFIRSPQPLKLPVGESSGYTANWSDVALATKLKRQWRCESCKFAAIESSAIQVHHLDGDKSDNSDANLQVLCGICHGKTHGFAGALGSYIRTEDLREMLDWHGQKDRGG